ncbi:MAG: sarcosine oxidase subunit gamma [Candidatus Competibacterales bacterium]
MSNVEAFTPPRPESPLHHADLPVLAGLPGDGQVVLQEHALWGHWILRGNGDDPAFVHGVAAATGLSLPVKPLTSATAAQDPATPGTMLWWLGPDEWLLLAPPAAWEATAQALVTRPSSHSAVVDVSGGQTWLSLSGPKAGLVLAKSTTYDIHPRAFPVGKCVGTRFAEIQVFLRRQGPEQFQLVVRRSFADYLWLWLQDASWEYGLTIRA